jgi:hypothetical protein
MQCNKIETKDNQVYKTVLNAINTTINPENTDFSVSTKNIKVLKNTYKLRKINFRKCVAFDAVFNNKTGSYSNSKMDLSSLKNVAFKVVFLDNIKDKKKDDVVVQFSDIKYVDDFAVVSVSIIDKVVMLYILKNDNNQWKIVCEEGLSIM